MINVVLDTNVIITALKSKRGACYKLLSMIDKGIYFNNISTPLIKEYEYVIQDRGILNAEQSNKFVNYICKVSKKHKIFYLWRPFLKDPKDDLVLELAFKSKSMIVTYNLKDFKEADQLGVKIMTPKEFLQLIGG